MSAQKIKLARGMIPRNQHLDPRGHIEAGINRAPHQHCAILTQKSRDSMCKTKVLASGICLIVCAAVVIGAAGWASGFLRREEVISGPRDDVTLFPEPLTNTNANKNMPAISKNEIYISKNERLNHGRKTVNISQSLHDNSGMLFDINVKEKHQNIPKRHTEKPVLLKKTEESIVTKFIDKDNNKKQKDDDMINDILAGNRSQESIWRDTQISSPDDQVTTHLTHLSPGPDPTVVLRHEVHQQIRKKDSAVSTKPEEIQHFDKGVSKPIPHVFAEEYGVDDYFYNEDDAHAYYYDYETNTWTGYLLEKIQELYDWVTTDFDGLGGPSSKGSHEGFVPQVLKALNFSIIEGNSGILLESLKNMYYSKNATDFDPERSRKMLANTSSVVSFGLLALDVMLLRNIQLMAWDDQETANEELTSDPEIFAMNALFMDPKKVKNIYRELEMHKAVGRSDSTSVWSASIQDPESKRYDPTALTSGFYANVDLSADIAEFAFSAARAANHLGRAFREARTISSEPQLNSPTSRTAGGSQIQSGPSELDCMWTLYCRNLNKASNMNGPYGFLARLNSLGLRVVIGDLQLDKTIEVFLDETLKGSKGLQCDRIFPKCSGQNASKIVLEGIIGKSSRTNKIDHRQRIRNSS